MTNTLVPSFWGLFLSWWIPLLQTALTLCAKYFPTCSNTSSTLALVCPLGSGGLPGGDTMAFRDRSWWVWITHSSLLAINFNLYNYSMKLFFSFQFTNYKTKARYLTSWSFSFKIHKMLSLLLLLNQGLSNVDQKWNCPLSLLFWVYGLPADPEACVKAPGSFSSYFSSVQSLSSVRLSATMNRSTPGLPVHHHLLEFTQTHVHRVSDAI